MPAGKKYRNSKRPMKKRKQRVATAVTTKAVQKALLPLQERKYFQQDPSETDHVIFNSGVAEVSTDGQLSINNLVTGLVPKSCTVAIPNSFLTLATQGPGRENVEGRRIQGRTLSMRMEIDFRSLLENETTLHNHWYITKGWCKNTVFKGCHNPTVAGSSSAPWPAALPVTVDAHNIAASTIVARALVSDGFGSDPLQYRATGLPKNIIIEKRFKVKGNLNDRYADVTIDANDNTNPVSNFQAYTMPKTYYFNWKFNKSLQLDNQHSPFGQPTTSGGETNLGIFRSWIPFVVLTNDLAAAVGHTVTPHVRTSSKLTFTDM